MFVYLKYKDILKRILDVDLVNFIEPQVDGVSVEGTDPAVWFKVLLLDSIFVDCDARDVYWNKEAVVEATNIHWTKEEDLDSEEIVQFYKNKGKNSHIFTLIGPMEFSIKFDIVKSGWSILCIKGSQSILS